jgi:hypothetical protein
MLLTPKNQLARAIYRALQSMDKNVPHDWGLNKGEVTVAIQRWQLYFRL